MSPVALLYPVLVVVSAAVGLAGLVAWRWRSRTWPRHLNALGGWLCTALALSAWGLRWHEAGHLPLFGTYESALSLCVAVLGTTMLWEQLRSFEGEVAPVACLLVSGIALHGMSYDAAAYALTISERSWVVDVHAVVAWLAFGVLALNAALALRCMVRSADERCGRWLARSLHWGFVLHSGMMVSGSFYKFLLFGRAWSFDPIETLGFVAWISYGTLIHLHLFAGWKGRRLAGWCLLVFVLLVISYRGIVYFPSWSTYHIFDMDLRMHIVQ